MRSRQATPGTAYSGDPAYYASTSAALAETVNLNPSATSLAASPNPAGLGQTVTLSASVSGTGTTVVPTGTLAFFDGPTQLGSATLDAAGHASFTTSALGLGTHSLTAVYAGNAVFTASTSAPLSEIIVKPDFTIALSSPSLSLQTYRNDTMTITLASLGNFSDSIALACGSPPQYVTCSFTPAPATLTANGTTTVSLYLDTDSIPGGYGRSGPLHRHSPTRLDLTLWPVGLLAGFGLRRKRTPSRLRTILLATASISLALGLGASGGSQIDVVPSTAPGTYVIPITATASSTGLTLTAQLTLTVTP